MMCCAVFCRLPALCPPPSLPPSEAWLDILAPRLPPCCSLKALADLFALDRIYNE